MAHRRRQRQEERERARARDRPAMTSETKRVVLVVGVIVVAFSVVLGIVLANPSLVAPPPTGVGIERGQYAPDFTLVTVNGTSWNLAAHRGQVVLIDFMGSRCSTCELEMREGSMQSVYNTYSSRNFTILSIDIGGGLGTRDPAEAWRFVQGLNSDGTRRWAPGYWPIALDNQRLAPTFGVSALPHKYLIDMTGRIAWKHIGFASAADLEAQVTPLLG